MGNTQSCVLASFSVCSVYLLYFHIYCSHKWMKTNVLSSDKLPSFLYLFVKYTRSVFTRRKGYLDTKSSTTPVYTVLNCRLQSSLLRRFCSAAGYGWDYPDSEYRDVPMCFPEFLCHRLLLMLISDKNFRLSPSGLVRVRQRLKSFQPIDELKKGKFILQVGVQGYQQTDGGVEVDIRLSAITHSGSPVWESVVTLLSTRRHHKYSVFLPENAAGQTNEQVPENVKQVELRVPRTVGLQRWGSFTDFCSHIDLMSRFFSFRSQTAPGLWMLSICLAEIEKHKGVGVITAPVDVTAQFHEPLLMEGKVIIRFWEAATNVGQSSAKDVCFHLQRPEHGICHMEGRIFRS